MNRTGRVALSILTGFVVAVIIASACIVAWSQFHRAEAAEDKLDDTETELTDTDLDLQSTRSDLGLTRVELSDIEAQLTDTRDTLSTTVRQRDSLTNQINICRRLVPVNDRLLFGMLAQSRATDRLEQGHELAAAESVRTAGEHARAVQRLVDRAGFKSLSGLVAACVSPPGN